MQQSFRPRSAVLAALALLSSAVVVTATGQASAAGGASYREIGQQSMAGHSLATRCNDPKARFNRHKFGGGFSTDGPTGVAISSSGRLFVADDGGQRLLSWPDADSAAACQPADAVIGAGQLVGPEAIAVDGDDTVYVADTLDHTVKIFAQQSATTWALTHTLGYSGESGSGFDHFDYPRGLAVDERGRLFVADDDNNRVLIFDAPFTDHEQAADSIYAGNDGGLAGPKAVAISGDSLFVADYYDSRVLRFTGPFDHPDQTYTADATFTGVAAPVDLAVSPNGALYVSDQGSGDSPTPSVAMFAKATRVTHDVTQPSSRSSKNILSPLGLTVDAAGQLFVSEYSAFRVLVRTSPADAVPSAPVDGNATAATAALLADLRDRSARTTGRVAIGQEMASFRGKKNTGWYREFYLLHQAGEPTPLIMSTELSFIEAGGNSQAVDTMIDHAAAGGIVAVDWHPDNPVDPNGYTTPLTNAQLASVLQSGTAANTAWLAQLDKAAAGLRKFADAGVPVLFRPLVESNGTDFFWWGDDGGYGAQHAARQALFAQLWESIVDHLRAKGLHDLLYVYSANAIDFGEAVPAMDYYPGSGEVDVTGVDVYQERLNLLGNKPGLGEYQALATAGKPFGLSEFGQTATNDGTDPDGDRWDARILTTRLSSDYPRAVYAVAWYSSFGTPNYVFGLSDVAHVPEMLADPIIDTLGP